MNDYLKYQSSVLNALKKLLESGILIATGGNLSTRVLDGEKIGITPSNNDYTLLEPEEIRVLDYAGNQISGPYNQ